jgi:hydroxymethylpyrimidine/phosphomethylpyrimidine kinase
LEADQKVLAAHGCYAMTATTALTAQNTKGVKAIHAIPSSFVEQQIEACIEDVGVDVIKTGLLKNLTTRMPLVQRGHGLMQLVLLFTRHACSSGYD